MENVNLFSHLVANFVFLIDDSYIYRQKTQSCKETSDKFF